jgi:transcriptional regulator of acetoin/glycerol metabolism
MHVNSLVPEEYIFIDVSAERRDIAARIYGADKHVSPTTNNNSWERCVTTRELEPLRKVFPIQSSENLLKEYSRSQLSDSHQPEK